MADNRYTLESVGHAAQLANASKTICEEMDHSQVIPQLKKAHGHHGETLSNVQVVQPYGFCYWVPKQQEQQQQAQQRSTSKSGGSQEPGGTLGPIDLNHNQPRGLSAEGPLHYANGSRNFPYAINLTFPDHHLMLQDPQQETSGSSGTGSSGSGSQQSYGGSEGDVAIFHKRQLLIQAHAAGGDDQDLLPGFYISTVTETTASATKKHRIRLQLVDPEQSSQQQSGGRSGAAGSQQAQQKSQGQRPILKRNSTTYIDIVDGVITVRRGSGYAKVSDGKVIGYVGDETKSFMVNGSHTHIRFGDNRIFVDAQGCWTTKPIEVKPDGYDS